ncbi:S-adenosyl-L-methionine-dependent methyltransferase, partial [Meira miltonrushii]
NPLMFANAARVPFFLKKLSQHFSKGKGKDSESLDDVKILDIGCGGGLVTEEIAKHTKAKVIGIDLSKQSIAKARQHSPFPLNRLAYVIGSAYELPFADGSIDAIVCSDVFEHLHDVPLAMREIHRVLHKGGMLVYDTVNRTMFSWYGTIVIAQNILHYVPDHSHDWRMYIRPEEMQRAAQQAGLQHAPLSSICGMRPTL